MADMNLYCRILGLYLRIFGGVFVVVAMLFFLTELIATVFSTDNMGKLFMGLFGMVLAIFAGSVLLYQIFEGVKKNVGTMARKQ